LCVCVRSMHTRGKGERSPKRLDPASVIGRVLLQKSKRIRQMENCSLFPRFDFNLFKNFYYSIYICDVGLRRVVGGESWVLKYLLPRPLSRKEAFWTCVFSYRPGWIL
jgi:hypothetical protein